MTSNDLEKRDAMGPLSPRIFFVRTYARTVPRRTTKFGSVTCVKGRVFRGRPRPQLIGVRPLRVQNFWDPTCVRMI